MNKLVVLFCLALARNSLASLGHHVPLSSYGAPLSYSTHTGSAWANIYATSPIWGTRTYGYAATAPAIATEPHLTARTYAARPAVATTAYAAAAPVLAARTTWAATPAVSAYAAPVVGTKAYAAAAPAVATYAAAPAIASGYAAAAPAIATGYAAAAPVIAAPAVAVAPAARLATPTTFTSTGVAIEKNIHYGTKSVVTGYTSTIHKPNFGALATPLETVSKQAVVAAGRQVQTIIPQVTKVEPEVTVKKVPYDVPVPTPVVSEVEVRTPVVRGPAVAIAPAVATPAVTTYAAAPAWTASAPAWAATKTIAAAPAWTATKTIAAAPAWTGAKTYAAAPVWTATKTIGAAPAWTGAKTYAAAPAWTATKTIAAAPSWTALNSYTSSIPAISAAPHLSVAAAHIPSIHSTHLKSKQW